MRRPSLLLAIALLGLLLLPAAGGAAGAKDNVEELHRLIKIGDADEVKALIASGKLTMNDLNGYGKYGGKTALILAAEDPDTTILGLLLRYKTNPNIHSEYNKDEYPLTVAVRNNNKMAVIMLTTMYGAKKEMPGMRTFPLEYVQYGKPDAERIVALLLGGEDKADPNRHNPSNEPPLILAVAKSDFQSVQHLVKAGANVNVQARITEAPLLFFVTMNEQGMEIAKFLVESGVDLKLRNSRGDNVVHNTLNRLFETSRNNPLLKEFLQFYIASKANVNAKNENKQTPLHLAAENCYKLRDYNYSSKLDYPYEVIKILLQAGTDPGALDKNRKTFMDILEAKDKALHAKVQKLL